MGGKMLKPTMREMFITNMKALRKVNGFTQETFAARLKIDRSIVGAWEEHRGFPKIETLVIISDLFQKDLKDMLTKKVLERFMEA